MATKKSSVRRTGRMRVAVGNKQYAVYGRADGQHPFLPFRSGMSPVQAMDEGCAGGPHRVVVEYPAHRRKELPHVLTRRDALPNGFRVVAYLRPISEAF